jgi:N-acetylneuraminic acid mutarotase
MATTAASVDYQPRERDGHTSHVIGGNLYIWGGDQKDFPLGHDSEEKKSFTSCIEVLDIFKRKWQQHQTFFRGIL